MKWLKKILKRWFAEPVPVPIVEPEVPGVKISQSALAMALMSKPLLKEFPIQAPRLMPGVVPEGIKAPVLAMDSAEWGYLRTSYGNFAGFPGYPYLSELAVRAEYRAFASALSSNLTREWISINSTETAADQTKQKVTDLEKALHDIGLKDIIAGAAADDCMFGRAQIAIDIVGQDETLPLIISPKTIKVGDKLRLKKVEAMWTTPSMYNSIDPTAPDFYRPTKWFMLGKEIHASRLLTVITRPVPDILKAAFNFGGISLSQLAEPYVNNWLRTRQSVSDLVNNFSITAMATDMAQLLQSGNDGADVFRRADFFTAMRSNRGLMLIDKTNEDLVQLNVPLGGLHELQAQSQEQMCSVTRIPSTILTGIAPSGFGNVGEGEIKAFYDWIASLQEDYWRYVIDIVLKILQLTMYGAIDPDITFVFNPLYQMTAKELAEIRKADADTAAVYLQNSVLAPTEVREKIARDPESGYQGLALDVVIEMPESEEDDDEEDSDDPDGTDKSDDDEGSGSGKLFEGK